MNEILVIKRKIVRTSAKKKSLPDPEFDRISWVVKARMPEGEHRRIICGVKIEDTQIVASDGHILCIAKFSPETRMSAPSIYPIGCYEVLLANWRLIVLEKTEGDYPDYSRVIPIDDAEKEEEFYGSMPRGFSMFLRKVYQHCAYDFKLLQRVFFNDSFIVEYRSGMLPLVIKSKKGDGWDRLALVMPMKE